MKGVTQSLNMHQGATKTFPQVFTAECMQHMVDSARDTRRCAQWSAQTEVDIGPTCLSSAP